MRRRKKSRRSGAPEAEWIGAAASGFALRLATVAAIVMVLGTAILALPGEPGDAWHGLKLAADDYTALVPLAAIALVVALWTARGWTAHRLLRTPGPIKVLPLDDATVPPPSPPQLHLTPPPTASENGASGNVLQIALAAQAQPGSHGAAASDGAPVVRLGMQLREHLSHLRLSAPTAIPGAGASSDFVELLGVTKIDAKQPLATVGQLLRLSRPTHAYEVKATVLRREKSPAYGVVTETVIVPRRITVLKSHWAASWDEAIELAATAIGALIVPLSRHSTHGVWATWRGKVLDERLFRDHQHMQQLRREQRYDEAIGRCYAALRRDPFNDHLRFQLGLLQEELALYVDALLTYTSILDVAKEQLQRAKSRAARKAQRRIHLLAAYRFTVLLGYGERLSPQWTPAPAAEAPVRRIEELAAVRARLRPWLLTKFGDLHEAYEEDLELLGVRRGDHASLRSLLADDVEEQDVSVSRRKRERQRKLRQARLRLLLQVFALRQVEIFLGDWGDRNLTKYDVGLTATAIDLLPTWADLRAQAARRNLRRVLGRPEVGAWPPKPEDVELNWRHRRRIGRRTVPERLARSHFFIDHYNAACTYAIGLLHEPGELATSTADAERLVTTVVANLQQAARVSTSEEFARQWDWITSEDPDLAGVRSWEAFRNFEVDRYPSARPAPIRPANIVALEASRYSALLIRECARRFEAQWHWRAELEGPTDIHVALEWWDEELQAWNVMRELAHNHRHWQTRLEVIDHMQAFARRHGAAPFVVAHPRYGEAPLNGPPEQVEYAASSEAFWANRRMGALRAALGDIGEDPLPGLKEWGKALRDLDGAGQTLEEDTRRALCVNRARAWERLNTSHRLPVTSEQDLEEAKRRLTEAATSMSHVPVPDIRPTLRGRAHRTVTDTMQSGAIDASRLASGGRGVSTTPVP